MSHSPEIQSFAHTPKVWDFKVTVAELEDDKTPVLRAFLVVDGKQEIFVDQTTFESSSEFLEVLYRIKLVPKPDFGVGASFRNYVKRNELRNELINLDVGNL